MTAGETTRGLVLSLAIVLAAGCGSSGRPLAGSGSGGGGSAGTGASAGAGGTAGTITLTIPGKINNNLDLLFLIDDASGTAAMQQKFVAQLPTFVQVLQQLPNGLPNLHIAVVSSDMGAPSDQMSAVACTPQGDQGQFLAQPRGTCSSTTLATNATFLSDANSQANFTDPVDKVLQCIALLGSSGCGFEQPLAALTRALGADGAPPPAANAGFLRPDAYLGIVILSNEDDCSTPPNTTLYSLNGGPDSLANPLGPLTTYRCNRFGHLCKDASGTLVQPPLTPPAAGANPPPVDLTDCVSNDTSSGMLTPVKTFVQQIKALKADPDNQILVSTIAAPPDPYGVAWTAAPAGASGELWPQVMHSCGAAGGDDVNPQAVQHPTDGTFGDPGVRLAQFTQSFSDSVLASVCDASYASAMTAIATKVGALIREPCLMGAIQRDINGQPACTVVNQVLDASGTPQNVSVPNCNENGAQAPCWSLGTDAQTCPNGGVALRLMADAALQNAASFNTTVTCSVCQPGSVMPGC